MVAHASRESENRSQRRRLLAYPIVLLLIAMAVFALLCIVVVPIFASMFAEFGLILPVPTVMLVFVADLVQHHPIRFVLLVALLVGVVLGVARFWIRYAMTTRVLGVFAAGNSASVSAMSSLTSQLAELLSIDISLPDALWIAGQGCGHYHFKSVTEQLARDAYDGTARLSQSPVAHHLPANVIHALQAGPDGQPSIALLRELSAMYSDRVPPEIRLDHRRDGPVCDRGHRPGRWFCCDCTLFTVAFAGHRTFVIRYESSHV